MKEADKIRRERLRREGNERDLLIAKGLLEHWRIPVDSAWLLAAIESWCIDMTWEDSDATDLLMWVARQKLRSGAKVECAHAFYERAALTAIVLLTEDALDVEVEA